jgi:hypothetical protein
MYSFSTHSLSDTHTHRHKKHTHRDSCSLRSCPLRSLLKMWGEFRAALSFLSQRQALVTAHLPSSSSPSFPHVVLIECSERGPTSFYLPSAGSCGFPWGRCKTITQTSLIQTPNTPCLSVCCPAYALPRSQVSLRLDQIKKNNKDITVWTQTTLNDPGITNNQ